MAAFQGNQECHEAAKRLLADVNRELVGSQYLILELIPKPTFNKRQEEVDFMAAILGSFAEIAQSTPEITTRAINVACDCDVAGIDALHVAAALHLQAQELVTTEADTKPMFRVPGLKCTSILPK